MTAGANVLLNGGETVISRNGVFYDLNYSDYRVTVDGLTFVFSTQLHLDKFKAQLESHREKINTSLSRRFNYTVDASRLADIVLYKKVETRGFLIEYKGAKLCQKSLIFAGGRVTSKSCSER